MATFKTLMKMPQAKLASKCIALEELLQRYYQFEEVHYDLLNKYQLLQTKYERLNQQNIQLMQNLHIERDNFSQASATKMNSSKNCVSRILKDPLEEMENLLLLEELKNENQKIKEELQINKEELKRLQSKFEQTQTELLRSASIKTASDSKLNSIDERNYDSIQSYKNEIIRLNKIVSSLRIEISHYKTREFDEDWLKIQLIKYQKQSQMSNNHNFLDFIEN
ncbi:unnamed protein product [Paramecium pentaurelia]|uniref:Uncharacterized protein n=1 Tax=Paramecium pentaurelia TaxID=43138 RepID=A0A8S1SJI6_9CILI|nr:unnamed protein product [Paramecium pentaurelia]